ncbi:MAG: hypothetical protein ABL996_26690, partial [Micropepsaceae bacterium]
MIEAQVPEWAADRLRLFPAAVATEDCEKIIARGDALALVQGSLHSNRSGERFYDPQFRLTSIGWLKERDWIYDLVSSFGSRANAAWGFELNDADHLQYALYRRNDFFEWHQDM